MLKQIDKNVADYKTNQLINKLLSSINKILLTLKNKNGDKIFYRCDGDVVSGLTTGCYYIHLVDSNKFNHRLTKTLSWSLIVF